MIKAYNALNCFPNCRSSRTIEYLLSRIPGSVDTSNPNEFGPSIRAPNIHVWVSEFIENRKKHNKSHEEIDDYLCEILFSIEIVDEPCGSMVLFVETKCLATCISMCCDLASGEALSF